MTKKIPKCYECDNTKYRADGRRGGYNHKDCRNGKKDKSGKKQKCGCWCVGSSKYKVIISAKRIKTTL
jgi:hypothetical protein